MIGRRIGDRYEIIRYIGGGGMSNVYLARDVILDRNVAIKVLRYDFSNEEELKRRFQREALSATSLAHPNIVNIFDVGEDGETHYLVMEFIEGQTLKEFIQSVGPLSPEQAIPIMRQLVSAISNAHHNGIIHRDIKPQNILMDFDGNVKITDFGIAMALSATAYTQTNSVMGTVHYLSPEQARGGMATKKSDIYALGIVFYELLSGKLPFSGESAIAIALKHLQEETPSIREVNPAIPQSVENVIRKATAKDPLYRYRSADEMLDDLATVLSDERRNEPKFVLPIDDDATKAIPAIKEYVPFESVAETKNLAFENETKQVPPPRKKRKKWPIILGVAGLLLLIAIAILAIPLFMGPKKVEVPDVSNTEIVEATNTLEELGFTIDEQIEEASDEIEAGKVIRTSPEAGTKREKGSAITLYVSSGPDPSVLDNYIGKDYESIADFLDTNFKFRSIKAEEEFSDEPKGTIIGQTPEPGSSILPEETDLVFTVSKGKDMVPVKDLVNLTEAELGEYEKTSGFKVRITTRQNSDTVEEGRVISQTPVAGTSLEKGSTVEVVLSEGPEKKPVNVITRTIEIEYTGDAGENGSEDGEDEGGGAKKPQTVRIYIQDRNNTMADPVEEFTITETVRKRITIELEEGQRGAYRVMRDNNVVAEETFNYEDT